VLGDPADPHIRTLLDLPAPFQVEVGIDDALIRAAAPRADVLLSAVFSGDPFKTAWPLAGRVKWVHTLSAGVEHMLTPGFAASPVPLTNARGVYKRSLAEFALLGILFFAKDIPRMRRNQAAGRWEQFEVTEAHGGVAGIVGYGEIGRASATLARALGMKILANRRRTALSAEPDGIADAVFPPERLKEMLGQCDYVIVAAPGTPDTRGMLGPAELRAMKPGSVIINVGRGTVIQEAALIDVLREGHLRGAALDVFEHEPLPPGHPFYSMDNVLVSPHCADRTSDWLHQSVGFFLQNLNRFRDGQPLENIVDKKAAY
jgi:phosphoglycerate dehydrogenase-like enzyme